MENRRNNNSSPLKIQFMAELYKNYLPNLNIPISVDIMKK